MDINTQKYKLYITSALLYYEKQKIEELFNTYSTRLNTINDNMEVLLKDITNLKNIEDIPEEKQLNKLIELITFKNIF